MVIKEGKVIAVGILIALFLLVGNSAYFMIKAEDSVGIMSGNSIKEVVTGFYQTSSVNQRIFILFQFVLLILIIIVILIIVRKFKSKSRLSKRDFVKNGRVGSKTDIDILYEMLGKEKTISLSDVTKIFNVTPEVSMEWAKVLENGDLAIIEYPRFGKPVLSLPTNEETEEEGADVEKKMSEEKPVEKGRNELQKVVAEKVATKNIAKKRVDKKILKMDKKILKMDKKMEKISKRVKEKEISKHSKKRKKK